MKTGKAVPVKHTGGGSGPIGGGGFGPIGGGGGFGPIGGGGFGPIGGGPRPRAILKRIAKQLNDLAKAFEGLSDERIGGAVSGKQPAKKKL